MKKVLFFAVFAAVLCSCGANSNSNSGESEDCTVPTEDTVGVAKNLSKLPCEESTDPTEGTVGVAKLPDFGVASCAVELVDSASYLLGVNMGSMVKGMGVADNLDELNMVEARKGMEDFFAAKGQPNPNDPAFTSQFKVDLKDMDKIMTEYLENKSAVNVNSVSYLLGVNMGSMIKGWGAADNLNELNMAEVSKGMKDFFAAKGQPDPNDPAFTSQFKIDLKHMDRIMTEYLEKRSTYKNAVNKHKEKEFLASNAKNAKVTTAESGLQYTIHETGAEYKVQPADTVVVNYKGKLIDGTEFDAGEGLRFAANQVIKGWTEGLGLIGKGGKITLYIPSDLGYGDRALPAIPACSTLIFDVEVVDVRPCVAE